VITCYCFTEIGVKLGEVLVKSFEVEQGWNFNLKAVAGILKLIW
jgi:hypothetical protein